MAFGLQSPPKNEDALMKNAPKIMALGAVALLSATSAMAAPAAPPATFARCAVCHNATKDGPDKIGPDLWGVYGRKAATGKHNYTEALKKANLKWDEPTLDKWIAGPMQLVPGTAMAFPGIKDPAKRAELIAWLKTLK